jgi:erythromycin esterase
MGACAEPSEGVGRVLGVFWALPFVCVTVTRAQNGAADPVVDWARPHVFTLSSVEPGSPSTDLEPFKRVIGGARVIALGEPDHGIHEFQSFRNRLFRFLAEEMGVTAFAAETGYSESVAVDDYVNGKGELTPAIVGSVFSWSAGTPYADNRALIDWIRSYNARPSTKRKIHFYGLDLTGGRGGRFTQTRLAVDAALAYVAAVDSVQARALSARIMPSMPRFISGSYDSLTITDQNALTAAIDDLVGLFERRQAKWSAKTSPGAYDRAYHEAIVVRQLNANFRAASGESNPQAQREVAMSQNLRWVLEREGPQSRVLVFAANWHVSKGPMTSDRWGTSLGEHLHSIFGKDFVSIAGAYYRGESTGASDELSAPDSGSVAVMMSRLGERRVVLPLGDVPNSGPVADWFRSSRAMEGGRIDSMTVNDAFNAVVFIATVHPASTQ